MRSTAYFLALLLAGVASGTALSGCATLAHRSARTPITQDTAESCRNLRSGWKWGLVEAGVNIAVAGTVLGVAHSQEYGIHEAEILALGTGLVTGPVLVNAAYQKVLSSFVCPKRRGGAPPPFAE